MLLLRRLVAPCSTLLALACGGGDLVLPSDGEPALIEIADGDEQSGTVGLPLDDAIVVRLVDTAGRGVPDQAVTWVVATGGGSVTPETGTTDDEGLAAAEWTLGPSAGPNTVSAVVARVGGVTFRAMGTRDDGGPATPTTIEPIEGEDQSAPAGTTVAVPPAVRVTDGAGQPVGEVEVTFAVTGGGGTIAGDTRTTDSDGIARVGGWTLGSIPGLNTLEARAGSLIGSPVIFTAEGTSVGGVAGFAFTVQPRDVDEDEPFTVEVALVDAGGNVVPLSGVLLYVALFREGKDKPSNGDLNGERFRETVNGVAMFTGLRVTKNDDGYRFRARSDAFLAVEPEFSDPFDVD
jgi:hypothetical protein